MPHSSHQPQANSTPRSHSHSYSHSHSHPHPHRHPRSPSPAWDLNSQGQDRDQDHRPDEARSSNHNHNRQPEEGREQGQEQEQEGGPVLMTLNRAQLHSLHGSYRESFRTEWRVRKERYKRSLGKKEQETRRLRAANERLREERERLRLSNVELRDTVSNHRVLALDMLCWVQETSREMIRELEGRLERLAREAEHRPGRLATREMREQL